MRLIEKLEAAGDAFYAGGVHMPPAEYREVWDDIMAHARRLELEMPDDVDFIAMRGGRVIRIRFNMEGAVDILIDDELKLTLL